MTSDPVVSIVLPTYNNVGTIGAAIQSVIFQSFQDWELLLLDDGSTDGTRELVGAFDDPRIRLIQDGQHLGLAPRLNQGIDLARGSLIARMDGDDICYPTRLASEVAYLSIRGDVDLVGSFAAFFESPDTPLGIFRAPEHHTELCDRMPGIIRLIHPTWLGRATWFRRHHYHPSFRRIEDQELLLRANKTSRYACVQEIGLAYRLHSGSRRRVRNEILDQYYHLRLRLIFSEQRQRYRTIAKVILSRGPKLVYRPLLAGLGLTKLAHQRVLTPPTSTEQAALRELIRRCQR
ncbi:MAG: glycosyltransferase [Thermoflexales bacterium]|nr:glycosyltransferase [Thermoflexales bacterium]